MKKLDYISILAGGSCKFNCDFCIGKEIRKDVTPHFSNKWEAFLTCFADMTDLVSVSGDTSDPVFAHDFLKVPSKVREINPDAKVTLHTRDIVIASVSTSITKYDKHVLSIDDDFFEKLNGDLIDGLRLNAKNKKLRFSIVLLDWNWATFIEMFDKILKTFPGVHITFRPEVREFSKELKDSFKDSLGDWEQIDNGAEVLRSNKSIWFWDYEKTNQNLDVRYLFSNGDIRSNCAWDEIR